MNLYNQFFKDKQKDEQEFILFGERHEIRVKPLLERISNEDEFLATIIELRFGVFLNNFFHRLDYEKRAFPHSMFTPDWLIHSEEQRIVAEVFRLNPSKKDQEEIDFGVKLMDTLALIKEDYCLQLEYDYNEILSLLINFDDVREKISLWFNGGRELEEKLTLYDVLSFKVIDKNLGYNKVLSVGNFSTINFDYRRLSGGNSRLLSKLKYAQVSYENDMPYIICVYLSFQSWFKPEDVYEKLYGSSVEFHHNEPWGQYYPNAPFHDISKGLFYTNMPFRKYVSGILVRYQDEYIFFPNYSSLNKLSNQVLDLLRPFFYKELKD